MNELSHPQEGSSSATFSFPKGILQKQYIWGLEVWPFLKFNLQTSFLHTHSSRIGKLIAEVIAMLMHSYKPVRNTALFRRGDY